MITVIVINDESNNSDYSLIRGYLDVVLFPFNMLMAKWTFKSKASTIATIAKKLDELKREQ